MHRPAVMFGSLAIFMIMFCIFFDPARAFRNGAVMTLVMTAIQPFEVAPPTAR